jgi:hypothetical protein
MPCLTGPLVHLPLPSAECPGAPRLSPFGAQSRSGWRDASFDGAVTGLSPLCRASVSILGGRSRECD